jgi:hypothetical protein
MRLRTKCVKVTHVLFEPLKRNSQGHKNDPSYSGTNPHLLDAQMEGPEHRMATKSTN